MLKNRDVACLLAEPAMTNIGIIHPEPGYWEKARAICKKYGTLLIMDETHTICAGPGGFTRAYDISPDIFVIGKRKQNLNLRRSAADLATKRAKIRFIKFLQLDLIIVYDQMN
jgi:4-aminobutyrate aminotransferase-like enzyme